MSLIKNIWIKMSYFVLQVDSSEPAFPRAVGPWWFGCGTGNKGGNLMQHPLMNKVNSGPSEGDYVLDTGNIFHPPPPPPVYGPPIFVPIDYHFYY